MIQDLVDPDADICLSQILRERAITATWPQVQPHLGHPLDWLNPVAKKCPQKVHTYATLPPQLLDNLTQGLQLTEVLLRHPFIDLGIGMSK
jgi:hypothetical protein